MGLGWLAVGGILGMFALSVGCSSSGSGSGNGTGGSSGTGGSGGASGADGGTLCKATSNPYDPTAIDCDAACNHFDAYCGEGAGCQNPYCGKVAECVLACNTVKACPSNNAERVNRSGWSVSTCAISSGGSNNGAVDLYIPRI